MSSEPSARHPASLLLLGCCCCEFYLTHVTTVQNPNFQATYKEAEEQHKAAIKQIHYYSMQKYNPAHRLVQLRSLVETIPPANYISKSMAKEPIQVCSHK